MQGLSVVMERKSNISVSWNFEKLSVSVLVVSQPHVIRGD